MMDPKLVKLINVIILMAVVFGLFEIASEWYYDDVSPSKNLTLHSVMLFCISGIIINDYADRRRHRQTGSNS